MTSKNSREEKLEKLKGKKAVGSPTVLHADQAFLEGLQKKIDELRNVLKSDINVNLDDLLEQLSTIRSIAPAVEKLQQSIKSIEFPDVPENIRLVGLQPLFEAIERHVQHIQSLKSFKVPNAKVEIVNNQKIGEITERLDNLVKVVRDSSVQSQAAEDYMPVRRVIKIGNSLVFDDSIWVGGGGSSSFSSSGGDASATNQLTANEHLNSINEALAAPLEVKLNQINNEGVATGIGAADPGTQRMVLANDQPTVPTAESSSTIYDGSEALIPQYALVSTGISGDNTVVAAVAGKKIRVLSYVFISSGTVTAIWQSGATDISGPMSFLASTGVSAGYNSKGHFETNAGEALQINQNSTAILGGHLTYIEISV